MDWLRLGAYVLMPSLACKVVVFVGLLLLGIAIDLLVVTMFSVRIFG